MNGDLRPLYSHRPACDHAAERIPPVGENQNHMRYDEKHEDPHEPEMPNARRIEATKDCCQRMELHGLVNRPACSYRKEPGERNREVCRALERLYFVLKVGC